MKRFLSIFLLFVLCLSSAGCGKDDQDPSDVPLEDQGGFSDVEVSPYVPDADISYKNTYKEGTEPFGLEYKNVELPRSHQYFKVPAEMSVSIETARHLTFSMEGCEDLGLKGMQLHLHLKTPLRDESSLSGYTPQTPLSSFLRTFNNELIYSIFRIGGQDYNLDSVPEIPAQILSSISEDAGIFVHEDSGLLNTSTASPLRGYGMLILAYEFDDIPCIWITAVPDNAIDNAKRLLTYIVSTVKYMESPDRPFSEVTQNGFTFCVPPGCIEQKAGGKSFYQAPYIGSANAYAGFGVGVFDYESSLSTDFRNIYELFTGNYDDKDANIYCYGHEDNVDLNGHIADFCETYYANSKNPDGNAFFMQGTQVIFRVYKFGDKAFVIFDKDDLFTYHFEEMQTKCFNTAFNIN